MADNGTSADLYNETLTGGSPAVNTNFETGILTTVSVIGIAGVIGNAVVMFVVYRAKQLHNITNYFVAHQAFIDCISSFFILYHYILPIPKPPAGVAGHLLCKLWAARFPMWMSLVVSTYNLVTLTLERYIAIVFPFTYLKLFTPRRLIPIFIGTWVFATLFKSVNLLRTTLLNGRCVHTLPFTPAEYKVIALFTFLVQYAFPLLFMFFAYLHVVLVISSKITNRVGPSNDLPQVQQDSMSTARRNVIKTQMIVCAAFAILWAPNQFYFFIRNFTSAHIPNYFHNVTIVIAFFNSCVNPFIYALKYKQFHSGMKVAFRCSGSNSIQSVTTVT